MTEWKMDTGHMTRLNLLGVYEQDAELDDLYAEKLGHLLPKCRPCGINATVAMLDAQGVAPDETADLTRAEILRQVQALGPERLEQWAAEEADELLAVDAMKRRDLLDADPHRYGFPQLVDELVDRCRAQVTKDSRRALELAELAVDVSLRVDPEIFHDLAFHTRARAAAHRGNCLRLCDQAHAAREAFEHARGLHERAQAPDPEVDAEIPYLEASLAMDQRRFEEAEKLLERAAALYHQLEQPRNVALTRLKHANLHYHCGRPSVGLPVLEEAARLLKLHEEPALHLQIRYSQALYAVEAGRPKLARRHYRGHQKLLESRSEPWFNLRLIWLRAKIARSEGEADAAGKLYRRAREGFLAEGLAYDAALVALELAVLHLEHGNTGIVRRLAVEMAPIFQAQEIHREALAALVLFERAARTETLTMELALRLRRFLELARLDPSLRLEELRLEG